MAKCSECKGETGSRKRVCSTCKPFKEQRIKDKEKIRCLIKATRQYYTRKDKSVCVRCGKAEPIVHKGKCQPCYELHKQANVLHRKRVKEEVFAHYGGSICACCGESILAFLELDHIAGGGNKHRKENNISAGFKTFAWLKKNEYPEGFQVLCGNCNWGKHINGGVCPHKQTNPFTITETDYSYE